MKRAPDPGPSYPDTLSVREARARYFAANGLEESGYQARLVRLQAGPIPFWIPNTSQRVRSVRLHDIHHVVTGYPTTWAGEGEIGAWELASGCRDHIAAWVLNGAAALIGLCIAPRRVLCAFARGRRRRNLYEGGDFHEGLLAERLGALRRRLGVPSGGEEGEAAAPVLSG